MQITTYNVDEVENIIRFIKDDRYPSGDRINFIQADYVRHLMVQRAESLGYQIYTHSQETIDEVVSKFSEVTGIDIPDSFCQGTAVYNVPGVLMDNGVVVPLRILRQQIFLGASVYPVSISHTEHLLFHALGNALWNYLDYRVWGRSRSNDKKNEYRRLRDIHPANGAKYLSHQHSLFYIAAEDFRYLFGTPVAGRGEWQLENSEINPPIGEEVTDFWREELSINENVEASSA